MIGGGGRSRSSAGKCVICEGATSGKCVKTTPISSGKSVKPAPNWLIFWGLFAPLAAVVVIERLDKPPSNVSILFLFGITDHRILCHFGTLGTPESMPLWVWSRRRRTDKTHDVSGRFSGRNAGIITIGLTKERRKKDEKNDVENGVDEGKKLCPIYGTLSHLWYIKNNTNRVLDRT